MLYYRLTLLILGLLALTTFSGLAQTQQSQRLTNSARPSTVADIIRSNDLSIPTQRAAAIQQVRELQRSQRAAGRARARQLRLPVRIERKDGTVQEVVGLNDAGDPLYFTTHNTSAAISTGSNILQNTSMLTGSGIVIGMWDGGSGRSTHQEFAGGRMVVKDGSGSIDHATHVGGTMIASGVRADAKGMAVSSTVDSYDWNDDLSEMISRGAIFAGQGGRLQLSNHSYGYVRGWNWNGSRYVWGAAGTTNTAREPNFGAYNVNSQAVDELAFDAPYYLIFWSAANERNNNPTTGSTVSIGGNLVTYNPAIHPPGDGVYRNGFDTIADNALGKNVLTVGAVTDAVLNGVRDVSRANVTSFTSWGPTDDGRIKPDIVANGDSLLSSTNGSNTSYGFSSGTSMSSPNAAGTAAQLLEHYSNLFPGSYLRASTLKALLLHTADDRGNPGPDYAYGWGLLNGVRAAEQISEHAANPALHRIVEQTVSTVTTERTLDFFWDGVSPIRATLCWTDPAAEAVLFGDTRTSRLINNLNLKITGPDGTEYFPYVMPFVGTWTDASMNLNATTGVNNTDNVEQVYIANPTQAGRYTMTVSVSGTLTNGEQHYSLALSGSAPNSAPTIAAIANQTTPEDTELSEIPILVSDNETPSDLSLTATSANPDLVGQSGLTITETEAGYSLTISPVENAFGTTQITVEVSDGELTSSANFLLTVTPVNDAPTITPLGDVVINMSTPTEPLQFTIGDVDNEVSSLSVIAESSNTNLVPNENIVLSGSAGLRTVTLTPVGEQVGTANITLTVSDNELESQTSFLLTVVNPHPTFATWVQDYPGLSNTAADADPDGDGIANLMEYFLGLNPLTPDSADAMVQESWFEGVDNTMTVALRYRRNRQLNGTQGAVKWSYSPDASSGWTSEGVTDTRLFLEENYEWRRATVPWDQTQPAIFIRLDVE
jgi:hypothetical protein